MDFSAFDKSEMEAYAAEAKKRWGETEAYQESQRRQEEKSEEALKDRDARLMAVFARFGAIRDTDPASSQAQALAEELQRFITDNYYTCTKQILAGLGQMYVADDRFRANIDRAGGDGTAAFAAKAIEIYCG